MESCGWRQIGILEHITVKSLDEFENKKNLNYVDNVYVLFFMCCTKKKHTIL